MDAEKYIMMYAKGNNMLENNKVCPYYDSVCNDKNKNNYCNKDNNCFVCVHYQKYENLRVSRELPITKKGRNLGITECETGTKYDDDKLQWSLIPFNTIQDVCRVFMFGAKKYKIDNWKYVPDMKRRYYEAALRHLFAWFDGEVCDSESGLPHLSHAISCLIFLLWNDNKDAKIKNEKNNVLRKEKDD